MEWMDGVVPDGKQNFFKDPKIWVENSGYINSTIIIKSANELVGYKRKKKKVFHIFSNKQSHCLTY